jgi:ribosomal protein L11 methyltransferase
VLWYEITARVAPADVDGVSALMLEAAPGGVTVEEPITILGPEMGFRVRAGEPVFVRAYLPASELGAVLTEELRRGVQARYPSVELTAKPLYEEDWAVSWREFFGPVDYGGRLVIVPSWVEKDLPAGKEPIRLDPGQAFGTGHHETTRLCLAALEEYVQPGARVLDVGTGSGVLAIAAVKLGAASVLAIDVDPVAVRVAEENCVANGVAAAVEIRTGTLAGDEGEFDTVVANISTQANLAFLAAYSRVLADGGALLLSGILEEDAARFREAAPAAGLATVDMRLDRDWSLLVLRKAGAGDS